MADMLVGVERQTEETVIGKLYLGSLLRGSDLLSGDELAVIAGLVRRARDSGVGNYWA